MSLGPPGSEETEGLLSSFRLNIFHKQSDPLTSDGASQAPGGSLSLSASGGFNVSTAPIKDPSGVPSSAIRSKMLEPSVLQPPNRRLSFVDRVSHVDEVETVYMDDYGRDEDMDESNPTSEESSSRYTGSRHSSGVTSDTSLSGLGGLSSVKPLKEKAFGTKNLFSVTAIVLWDGLTFPNISKGFFWSLAITSMHYVGIHALRIPQGLVTLSTGFVILSAVISWLVCCIGSILMAQMETHLGRQLLFAAVATVGVAAMHFTGMRAATFWSFSPPSDEKTRGYPIELPIAIGSIAITTCLAANGLLAHSATVARNKLAEVVRTRKKLWAAIAQKENAEAAALARSEFIASASHEIRTPLHQLQGYGDLLSRTKLTEEGRLLLYAIQDATRTLSLITTNVLDWSRLEKGEAVCRPTALDVRNVCESVINLLPNRDDDVDVELLVAVTPGVPRSLFIDETYLHRIIMNLVSNALKFTSTGYVLLLMDMQHGSLFITIADTGIGIPESFLPELFEPFKQAQTRGAQRGTGLGLNIVKQLLEKMQGTIYVESKYKDDPSIGPENGGTKFTVRIPIQSTAAIQAPAPQERSTVALFSDHSRRLTEGFRVAWDAYNVDVHPVSDISDISPAWSYVWADASYLKAHQDLVPQLADGNWLVLVPYDNETSLYEVLGSSPARQFLPIRRPLIWHRIVDRLGNGNRGNRGNRGAGSAETGPRMVRFASEVNIFGGADEQSIPPDVFPSSPAASSSVNPPSATPKTVLLVEDNKINQKLGAKMLKTLGYEVLLASDGQDAIDMVVEHDHTIDLILMDQSMPRKDGLMATKEIRRLEDDGTLKGRRGTGGRRPIIAATAVVGPRAEMMCRQAGTDGFLAKPLSLARLKEALDMFLREE